MTQERILLLTDMPPTDAYTGGVVLNQICRHIRPEKILCYALVNKKLMDTISGDFGGMEVVMDAKPNEYVPENIKKLPLGRFIIQLVSFIKERYNWFQAKRLTRRIIRYCEDKNITTVWSVLQGQTIVRCTNPVAKALNARLVTQVWDSLNWWLWHHNIDKFSRKMLHQEYKAIMQNADCCASASDNMSDYFKQEYGTRCIPILYSVPEKAILPPSPEPQQPNKFVLGFAGQMYAYKTIMAFIDLLEKVDWNIDGTQIELALLGERYEHYPKAYKHIKFLGWRNQEELIPTLASFDALYLPYIFNPHFKIEMQTSFPSKLVTYLTAGKPIFLHAPDYSSAYGFLKKYDAGILCGDVTNSRIYDALERLIRQPQTRKQMVENGRRALEENFTYSVQKKRTIDVLNLEESDLR